MKPIAEILKAKKLNRDHRNTHEYQAYGNRLAEEFNDTRHRALYIRLAKINDRKLLEQARGFVMGQEHITYKGRLFMWKLKELKKESKERTDKPLSQDFLDTS